MRVQPVWPRSESFRFRWTDRVGVPIRRSGPGMADVGADVGVDVAADVAVDVAAFALVDDATDVPADIKSTEACERRA